MKSVTEELNSVIRWIKIIEISISALRLYFQMRHGSIKTGTLTVKTPVIGLMKSTPDARIPYATTTKS